MTESNMLHQFDLLYVPHNVFKCNKCKYMLTVADVVSRYKAAKALGTKKTSEAVFVLEAIYKKDLVRKYPKIFQCDNGSELISYVTGLLKKHNVCNRRITTKCKHTYTAIVDVFNKELAKQLFKAHGWSKNFKTWKMYWFKNLNSIVNKMKNTKPSMTDMKLK